MRIVTLAALLALPAAVHAEPQRGVQAQSNAEPPARMAPRPVDRISTRAERTQTARQITGNPGVNAGPQSMRFAIDRPVPLGRRMIISGAWYVDLPHGVASMRPTAGQVQLQVGPEGGQLSGLYLFECEARFGSIGWVAPRRGGGPMLSGSAQANAGRAAFVIDMGLVNGVQVTLRHPNGADWNFRACDVTPLS